MALARLVAREVLGGLERIRIPTGCHIMRDTQERHGMRMELSMSSDYSICSSIKILLIAKVVLFL